MDDPQPMRLDERLGDLTGERDRRATDRGDRASAARPASRRRHTAWRCSCGRRRRRLRKSCRCSGDRAPRRPVPRARAACGRCRRRRCGRQQFERHSPVEARVFGEIDVAHASCAQRGLNDITAEASAGSKRHGELSVPETRRSRPRSAEAGSQPPDAIALGRCVAPAHVTTAPDLKVRCVDVSRRYCQRDRGPRPTSTRGRSPGPSSTPRGRPAQGSR